MGKKRFDLVKATFLLGFFVFFLAIVTLFSSLFSDQFSLDNTSKKREPSFQNYIDNLGHENPIVRYNAARELGSKKAIEAVPALVHVLSSDEHILARHHAAWALGQIGADYKISVPALIDGLSDIDFSVRKISLESLQNLGAHATPAISSLQSLMESHWALEEQYGLKEEAELVLPTGSSAQDLKKRIAQSRILYLEAITTLGTIGAKASPSLAHLVKVLDNNDQQAKIRACRALGEIGKPAIKAKVMLIAVSKDPDAELRRIAVWALAELDSPKLLPALTLALKDADEETRYFAAQGIGRIGVDDKDSIAALSKCLDDDSSRVRKSAAQALEAIGTSNAQAELKRKVEKYRLQLKNKDWNERGDAAQRLRELGTAEAQTTLEQNRGLYPET